MILAFTIMMMHGLVNNLRAQIGPYILQDFGLNYSRLGILLSFLSIGAMILFFLSGRLIEKFGLIKILFFAIIYNLIALLTAHFSINYYSLAAAFFMVGSGLTLLNIVSVNIISITYSENRGKMMNLLHLFYGLGGIIAPYFVTTIMRLGFGWSYSFLFSTALLLVIFIEFKTAIIPEIETKSGNFMRSTKDLLQDIKVILFSLIIFFQIGVEFSIVTWLAPFLKDLQARSNLEVSFYVSLFFITFTIGRLLASFVVEKLGYYNFLIFIQIGAAVLIAAALIFGRSFTFLIPLSGFFMAAQVPTTQAAILDNFDKSGIKVVGFAQTAGMLGSTILASWLIGFVNDLIGLKAGFVIMIIVLFLAAVITFYLKKVIKKKA